MQHEGQQPRRLGAILPIPVFIGNYSEIPTCSFLSHHRRMVARDLLHSIVNAFSHFPPPGML